MEVDHIDHNGLNNQKENLRICNRSQNSANRIPSGKSKYLGVTPLIRHYRNKVYYYFASEIRINKKSIYLGHFKNEIEAALAYDKAAKDLHGEYANLNFK